MIHGQALFTPPLFSMILEVVYARVLSSLFAIQLSAALHDRVFIYTSLDKMWNTFNVLFS
jgi:hypothetical protein